MIKAHIEHAYSVRETATFGGGDHIVLEEDLNLGRLKRSTRDPLCKTRDKFKCLDEIDEGDDRKPNCKRCLEIAKRIGLTL